MGAKPEQELFGSHTFLTWSEIICISQRNKNW